MTMNTKNLIRMADYIETIPQSEFDMHMYRIGPIVTDRVSPKCNSVGCIIGHCTVLDAPVNIPYITTLIGHKYYGAEVGDIDFTRWSQDFTGLASNSDKWLWCFAGEWEYVDNTPAGAAKRIRWLVNHGVPAEFDYEGLEYFAQSYDSDPLEFDYMRSDA